MGTDAVGRVGRHGFTGSPITDWCGSCRDWVVRRDNGKCCWCDRTAPPRKAERMEPTREEVRAVKREERRLVDEQRDARIAGYVSRGFSEERIARCVGLTRRGVRYRLQLIEQRATAC